MLLPMTGVWKIGRAIPAERRRQSFDYGYRVVATRNRLP